MGLVLVALLPAGILVAGPRPHRASWEETLRRYNYRVLVDMLVSEFPEGSLEARRVREAGSRWLVPGHPLDDRYRERLTAAFPSPPPPRVKLARSLSWFLENYLELGEATLVPVALPPASAGGGTHRIGWDPELARVRRQDQHGLEDLEGYLQTHLGRELADLSLDPRTDHAFVDGDEAAALAFLARWGADRADRVNACGFNRRKKTLLGSRGDRVVLVMYGFESPEQRFNHEARLYFLRGPGGPVPALRIHGWQAETGRNADLEAFGRWMDRRPAFDTVCFGLVSPLGHLLGRKREERFGELRVWTADVPGAARKDSLLAISGFGASFGSFPARLLARMARRPPRRLVVVGTAGGLAGAGATGAWLFPGEVFHAGAVAGADGPRMRFSNQILKLPAARGARASLHATVDSILVETQPRVRSWIRSGVGSVDCELSHIIAQVRRSRLPTKLYVAMTVTDLPLAGPRPGGRRDYISNPDDQYRQARKLHGEILADLARGTRK